MEWDSYLDELIENHCSNDEEEEDFDEEGDE